MTSDLAARMALYEELLRRFASAVRASQLYAPGHPHVGRNLDGLLAALTALHDQQASVVLGIVGSRRSCTTSARCVRRRRS